MYSPRELHPLEQKPQKWKKEEVELETPGSVLPLRGPVLPLINPYLNVLALIHILKKL
jgi:hypothetical protein